MSNVAAEDTVHPNDHPERRRRPAPPPDETRRADQDGAPADTGQVADTGEVAGAEPDESGAEEQSSVRRATGRDRDEWFALLDSWGATERSTGEITTWLATEHGVSAWWAQKLTITYEQLRGIRKPGSRADGTYAATASRTIKVPADRAFEAVVDPEIRRRWLPDADPRLRASRPGRSARFDWSDGTSRVVFDLQSSGEGSTVVAVDHQRLLDATDVEPYRTYWRERLTTLKGLLEGHTAE